MPLGRVGLANAIVCMLAHYLIASLIALHWVEVWNAALHIREESWKVEWKLV